MILRGTSVAPRYSTMVAAGKFVAAPMADGVRCAGVIEFGRLAAGRSRKPSISPGRGCRMLFRR